MNVGARDTINIDESVHEIYKQLTEGNDPVNAPFKTMKDVFLWAACLGYKKADRKQVIGKKITVFRWAQFNSQIDLPILKSLSLSNSVDISSALIQDQIITIAEEYANSGIFDLKELINGKNCSGIFGIVETFKQ